MDHRDPGVGAAICRSVGDEPVREREIPVAMVRRVRHQHQVGKHAVGEGPGVEAVLAKHVAVHQPERLRAQQRQGAMDAAAGLQRRVALLAVAHADAEAAPVADVIADAARPASRG